MVAASADAPRVTGESDVASGSFGKSAAGSVRSAKEARWDVTLTTPWSDADSTVTVSPSATRTMSRSSRAGSRSVPSCVISAGMLERSAISVSVAERASEPSELEIITPPRAGIAERVAAARVTSWSSEKNGCLSTENFICPLRKGLSQ